MRSFLLALCLATFGMVRSVAAQALPDNVAQTPMPPAPGVSASLDSARAVRGASLQMSIYTYGPGDEVFERFGHIAIGMFDPATGQDAVFNWGMFAFNPLQTFLWRFLTGDTRYWMEGYNTRQFNAAYQGQNRSIRKQLLALTPMQKGALQDLLLWNMREENKYYRYDYYNDNCSTRVRDAINWAIGGALKPVLDTAETHFTWRGETARITGDNLPIYAGIEIALGQNADKHLTKWQSAFLPQRLADDIAQVSVNGTKLVESDSVLFAAQTRAPLMSAPPSGRQWIGFALGMLLFGALLLFARAGGGVPVITVFGTVWYVVSGLLGLALLLAATVTKHEPYMGSNLTLFQVQPLLLLTGLVWWARARDTRAGRAARALAMLCALIAAVGMIAQHIPALFHQHNEVVWLFMAPVTIGLGIVARKRRA